MDIARRQCSLRATLLGQTAPATLCNRLAYTSNHCRCTTISLQVTTATAAAHPGLFAAVDDHMPALSTMTIFAFEQKLSDDDTATHTGAQRQHEHARILRTAPYPKFSISGRVGIIGIGNRQTHILADSIANGEIRPSWKVWNIEQHPRWNVHHTGCSQADIGYLLHLQPRLGKGLLGGKGHPAGTYLGTFLNMIRDGRIAKAATLIINHTTLDVRATKVDTDKIGSFCFRHWEKFTNRHGLEQCDTFSAPRTG